MSHHSVHPEAERRALQLRLRKIEGQLKGVEGMLERDCDCAEVLNQLISARRALKSLSEKIINDHLQHCITEASNPEEGRRSLRELATVLKRYID